MMKPQLLSCIAVLLALGSVTACNPATEAAKTIPSAASQPPVSAKPESARPSSQVIALFLAKKDNLNNQFRGEIYPIALYTNGKYVDASQDLTLEIRTDSQREALIRNHQHKTPLNAIKTFTVVNPNGTEAIGQFTVDKLGISQFACSSFLVGQGQFESQQSLQSIFNALPANQSGGFSGSIGKQQFDETWRWTIATSQFHPSPMIKRSPPDMVKYKQDLLKAAVPLIAQSAKAAVGQAVVEQISVYDLNHDGQLEVFGTVRRGPDPKSVRPDRLGDPRQATTAYATLWLSYQNNQPTTIAHEVVPYTAPVSRRPYDVVSTLDINGDGIEEVIVRNNGYESTSFGIYEFNGNQLKQVFDGAGYGC